MRIVLQRVKEAALHIRGEPVAAMGGGIVALAGFSREAAPDWPQAAWWRKMVGKIPDVRIFPDSQGKSNRSLQDTAGELLLVSQFTLFADCRKGKRPSYSGAAPPGLAEELFSRLRRDLEALCPGRVHSGIFGEDMDVSLTNQGPVTIVLDRRDFDPRP
jgi:D-tyrosyl-tRNA(Tyr) deacylase